MINRLAGRKDLARISQTPGKTQALNYYSIDNKCYIVDLPGYGYAKASHALRAQFERMVSEYLDNRAELKGLIQLIDARHGPVSGDRNMLEWLSSWDRQILYVFTKAHPQTTVYQGVWRGKYDIIFRPHGSGPRHFMVVDSSCGVRRLIILIVSQQFYNQVYGRKNI